MSKSRIANAALAAGRVVKAAVTGQSVMVSDATKQARLKICDGCPEFKPNPSDRKFDYCGKCGCFTKIKAALATEKCPLSKWPFTSKSG